jgi:hypothetical protein
VELLKRHKSVDNSRTVNGVVRKAADAITNLAHENSGIKTRVRFAYVHLFFFFFPSLVSVITHFHGIFDYVFRIEGAIPYLVELLEHADAKVQRAAAGALRTLAFKNDENKNQVEGILAFSIHMVLFCYEFYS